jgi:L-rhamnose mutarotase
MEIVMERVAFRMKLHCGKKDEYRRRHKEIWPELTELLHLSGIQDYVIFLDEETNYLFASLKLIPNHSMSKLAESPIMHKWWDYMADLMEVESSKAPVVELLTEVFYME